MKNINYVELNLSIPWGTTDNIPQRTYILDSFLTQEEFTIENHAKVYYNSFLRDPTHFDLKNGYGSEFDDITITVLRDGNIYDIQYVLVIKGKNIKGHYRGSLTQIYF